MSSSRIWAIVAAALVAVVSLAFWRERVHAMELGRAQAAVARLRADSARQAAAVRRIDSVYVRDTVRLNTSTTRYKALRDTINLTDTVEVIRTLAAADTAILACRATLETCEQRVAARDSLIRTLGGQRQADQREAAARLALADPRLAPWVEATIDPTDLQTVVGRAGLDFKVATRFRLTAAAQYTTNADHPFRPLVGVRVRF